MRTDLDRQPLRTQIATMVGNESDEGFAIVLLVVVLRVGKGCHGYHRPLGHHLHYQTTAAAL